MIAINRSALTRVPTPRTRKNRNTVTARVARKPRRELSKISARKRKSASEKRQKKRTFATVVSGFAAKIVIATNIHKTKSRKRAG